MKPLLINLKTILLTLSSVTTLSVNAQTVGVDLVVDNDFAVFLGNSDSGSLEEIYQNNDGWPDQILNNSANLINVSNPTMKEYLYVVALNEGTDGNLSGSINGINIVEYFESNPSFVQQSQDIVTQLPGFNSVVVGDASYDVQLADLQTILPSLTWSNPDVGSGAVISLNPDAMRLDGGERIGFTTNDLSAYVYRIDANIILVPEPSSTALLGLGGLALILRRRK